MPGKQVSSFQACGDFKCFILKDLWWRASCSVLVSVCNTWHQLEQKEAARASFSASVDTNHPEHKISTSQTQALHWKSPWRESSAHLMLTGYFHWPIFKLSNSWRPRESQRGWWSAHLWGSRLAPGQLLRETGLEIPWTTKALSAPDSATSLQQDCPAEALLPQLPVIRQVCSWSQSQPSAAHEFI